MSTIPQNDTAKADSRSVRVREDVWEEARKEAFHRRVSITTVLDEALRAHFNLATDQQADDAA